MSCSGSGVTSAPGASQATPTTKTRPLSAAGQRLDREPLGPDRPLLLELAGQRLDGVLAHLDAAAGPERPHAGPRGHPGRPAPGQPAAVGVADDAGDGERVGGVLGDEAQRPADGLELEPQPVGRGLVGGQAGGQAVVGGRASVAQALERPRRRGRCRPRTARQGSSRQAAATWSGAHGPRARIAGSGIGSNVSFAPWRCSHWGWGDEADRLAGDELRGAAAGIVDHLGFGSTDVEEPVALDAVAAPRSAVARALGVLGFVLGLRRARCTHRGQLVPRRRPGLPGVVRHPPDVVARPRCGGRGGEVLEWAAGADAAVVPYGGGTSVVGGVEVVDPSPHAGVVAVDLAALDRVLEVDPVSARGAHPGRRDRPRARGASCAEHGLTLRHYPQSFELSTLGGWIATRAGGHFATVWTHIDDLVESVRAVTPAGAWESRRLPGSGAGPVARPDAARLRGDPRRHHRGVGARAGPADAPRRPRRCASPTFADGAEAVRAIAQSGLHPANCRLIDAREAALTGAGDGASRAARARLRVGRPPGRRRGAARALEICAAHGGSWEERPRGGGGAARGADGVPARAVPARRAGRAAACSRETFETAITWDRFPAFHAAVVTARRSREALGGDGLGDLPLHARVSRRPGAVLHGARARRGAGEEIEQWAQIKAAAADAVIAGGGTITHHHAVGRDHRPWYDRQRPGAVRRGAAGGQGGRRPGRAC